MKSIDEVVRSILASVIVLPVVSINGTAKHVLFEQYYEMLQKVDDLLDYMRKNGPNARDYGQQNMELYNKAATQYKVFLTQLEGLKFYLNSLCEHLQ